MRCRKIGRLGVVAAGDSWEFMTDKPLEFIKLLNKRLDEDPSKIPYYDVNRYYLFIESLRADIKKFLAEQKEND